jgi:hypothetical protein
MARPRLYLRLERKCLTLRSVTRAATSPEPQTEAAVIAVRLENRKVVGVGDAALEWKNLDGFQLIWPFDHPRLLLSDPHAAVVLLRQLHRREHLRALLAPVMVIQIVDSYEGGLTEFELRVLRSVVIASGVATVAIYEGDESLSEIVLEEMFGSTATPGTGPLLPIPIVYAE